MIWPLLTAARPREWGLPGHGGVARRYASRLVIDDAGSTLLSIITIAPPPAGRLLGHTLGEFLCLLDIVEDSAFFRSSRISSVALTALERSALANSRARHSYGVRPSASASFLSSSSF